MGTIELLTKLLTKPQGNHTAKKHGQVLSRLYHSISDTRPVVPCVTDTLKNIANLWLELVGTSLNEKYRHIHQLKP